MIKNENYSLLRLTEVLPGLKYFQVVYFKRSGKAGKANALEPYAKQFDFLLSL